MNFRGATVTASRFPLYMRGAALRGGLGQDDSGLTSPPFIGPPDITNLPADLSVDQIGAVYDAYNSGALSNSGFNQIVSGNVTSGNLTDFLNADPGAPQEQPQYWPLADGSNYYGTQSEYQAYLASGNAPGPSSATTPTAGAAQAAAAAAAAARALSTPAPSPRISVGTPQTYRLPDGSTYYGTPAEYQAYLQRTGQGSWFSGSTSILGMNVPNVALLIGGGLLAVTISGGRKR